MSDEFLMLDALVSLMTHIFLYAAMPAWALGVGLRFLRSEI